MKTILAFAGSNSSESINFKLLKYTASLIKDYQVDVMNMAKMPFPMYSLDEEKNQGYKNSLVELRDDIQAADGVIIAVNEHNGNMSAYFKNLLDWLSRLERQFMEDTKVMLISTSPGKGGAMNALTRAKETLPRFGATIVSDFSLPSFNHSFDTESSKITDDEKQKELEEALDRFLNQI
ncbi:NADPH-dependent FMN reductase [Robertkochia aurantiaca]|uniref:NADPH-dependent FMN reductase n=1 Tax=Robertkochia aurantiaca TaxID=2873700 RepID=UPI001CD00545|nr:NAD(P)H-dependent oxidoreductase [Robertkochia sp. 3YJGBD-33]